VAITGVGSGVGVGDGVGEGVGVGDGVGVGWAVRLGVATAAAVPVGPGLATDGPPHAATMAVATTRTTETGPAVTRRRDAVLEEGRSGRRSRLGMRA
jgi:hypothetical protein